MMREKPRKMHVRSNVGVRNPFPLAEAILLKKGIIKTPFSWTKISAETARSYLYKAFHLNYSRLFDPDPEFKSPLYKGLHREDRGSSGEAGKADPSSGSGKEFLSSRRSGANPCTGNVNSWVALASWKYPPAPPPAPSISCGGGPFGVDTLQGCAADCYFIAALSSVAWTDSTLLSGKPDTSNPPRHKYKFVTASDGSVTGLKVARPLGVDLNNNLVFARPTNNICVWPSLYEKAYAIFQKVQPPDAPDITWLNFGNPVTTLFEITGLPVDAQFVRSFDPKSLFDFINARSGGTETGGRTQYPLVAWTYYDSTGTPGGDAYTDDLLVANHSYSVLGTVVIDGTPCVVLRNPFGFSIAQPKPGIHDCSTWTYPISVSQGNFAMEMDAFTCSFEGIGYIV